MRFQTWPFLIAELVQFTAAANITVLGQGDLHQDTADSFLSCLNATGIHYRLYIDAGSTLVLPPGNRTLDTHGVDEFLLQCMMMACGTMDIAAEDTDEDNEEHMASVYASIVTYDWLVDRGARGLRAIGTRPAKILEDIFVRDEEETDVSSGLKNEFIHLRLQLTVKYRSNMHHSASTPARYTDLSSSGRNPNRILVAPYDIQFNPKTPMSNCEGLTNLV
ncbi:hypothetical protein AnigIFM63604_002352 [Aspergillus niger]|uniref:Uncharacterized protein n=1 Tax=Aspergillus niger TaxID=5061 RepID=A0A9W6ACE9_ASPNG|nr:hypothetical protein AnigIFM63604_002352 [Aspergillus niger]